MIRQMAVVIKHKKIKLGRRSIDAVLIGLLKKNLIVLKGSKGYVMCGYLNLKAAEKFKEVAVKIIGVSTINQALESRVFSCTYPAKRLGIYKGQPIKEVLKVIA